MYHCAPCKDLSIFGEYRGIAETLFPQGSLLSDSLWSGCSLSDGLAEGRRPDLAAAAGFAEALGIGVEYQRLLRLTTNNTEMRQFLGHFQNNLDLLIQKTWVEKADEERKERLQDDVPPLVSYIMQENFPQALEAFGAVLEELAYLFFGAQSTKDDFMDYTFRIDEQLGWFWWYGSQLGRLKKSSESLDPNDEFLWAVLLIGICYLTNF